MSERMWNRREAREWATRQRAEERLDIPVEFFETRTGWRPYVSAERLIERLAWREVTEGHKVPDWRPGAVYWRPLEDGREITVYPLLFSKARLCVGPLADPIGYDNAYLYLTIQDAVEAAEAWNTELESEPSGYLSKRGGLVAGGNDAD